MKTSTKESDKLILTVYRPSTSMRGSVIRVDDDCIEILGEVQRKTGLSIKAIASKMIQYSASHIEIREVK
ncbi:MAG: hypothetical protein RSF84_07665 [Ruthenibacterium sp.]